MLGQVAVYEPGEVFLTLADGVPRMWGVRDDGCVDEIHGRPIEPEPAGD